MIRGEGRLYLFMYLGGAPAVAACLVLLTTQPLPAKLTWTVGAVVLATWLFAPLYLRDKTLGTLRTFASVLEAFREGDYSVRARDRNDDDGALSATARELNALGAALREHRLRAMEAGALLDRVVRAIDVAVLAIDDAGVVRLANHAATKAFGKECEGARAADLGVAPLLEGPTPRVLPGPPAGGSGPMELYRSAFQQGGREHTLIVLADVGRALRDKEREAWQRIVRVLGHEINSSLSPLQSLAGSLRDILDKEPRPADWEDDMRGGLAIIGRRSAGLSRFLSAYARLAKLPPPALADVDVASIVARAALLEQRVRVQVEPGAPASARCDADQVDQAMINLVNNAAEARLEPDASVRLSWARDGAHIAITVDDDGPGVAETANLFVPFFTTKPEGSGIGLALARQIAEAHGGTVTLETRSSGGARATLRLPSST